MHVRIHSALSLHTDPQMHIYIDADRYPTNKILKLIIYSSQHIYDPHGCMVTPCVLTY